MTNLANAHPDEVADGTRVNIPSCTAQVAGSKSYLVYLELAVRVPYPHEIIVHVERPDEISDGQWYTWIDNVCTADKLIVDITVDGSLKASMSDFTIA